MRASYLECGGGEGFSWGRCEWPINPLGRNGQPMTSKCYGSFRHILRDFPDSWENSHRVVALKSDEGKSCFFFFFFFFTGCNKQVITVKLLIVWYWAVHVPVVCMEKSGWRHF